MQVGLSLDVIHNTFSLSINELFFPPVQIAF